MTLKQSSYVVNEGETPIIPVQLLQDTGEPVDTDTVSAATLSLYYVDSDGDANTINSRSAVDVLGANGGSFIGDTSITGATKTDPVIVTAASHNLLDGYDILISSAGGMVELNDAVWTIRRLTSSTFSLRGSKGTTYTTYTSGGSIRSGVFLWQSAAADMAIQNSSLAIGDTEEHVAKFTFTFSDGSVAVNEYKFRVRNLG